MSLESNFSTESSEQFNLDPLSIPLQPMTIRKIDLNRLTNDYVSSNDDKEEEPSLEKLAKHIIYKYNSKNVSDEVKERQKFKIEKLDDVHFNKIESEGYSVVHSYCSVIMKSQISRMLDSLAVEVDNSCCVHHIFFFFRSINHAKEMFALCCGTRGYVPTVEYTDYSFPKKIACRLLDPKEKSRQSTKSICGHVISSQELLRSNELFDINQIQKLYINFTAMLRRGASIFAIDEFRTKTGKIPKCGPEFEIQEGGIRIHKQLSLASYFLIFNHFSKICRGAVTRAFPTATPPKEEKDDRKGFDFLFYYSTPPYATKSQLETLVLQTIQNYYYGRESQVWELYHPKTNDYFQARKHRLKYSKKNGDTVVKMWPLKRLSYEEMITELRRPEFENILTNPWNKFEEELGNITLGYHDGKKWNDEKLTKCLSGQIEHKSKVYFKFNAKWYETSVDLQNRINCEFKDCVTSLLIDENDDGYLPHPWQPKQDLNLSKLSKQLRISETDVADILKKEVCFIDAKGKVLEKELRGEILHVPEINYFKKDIEEILQNSYISKTNFEKSCAANFADIIFEQLTENRKVGQKNDKNDNVEVMNAFFPETLAFDKFSREQCKAWQSAEQAHLWRMNEEEYNRTYLYDASNIVGYRQPYEFDQCGWIVGDQILTDGIELFDVMYYTPTTLYLYHVKESFGQKTRDACSQIRNSCGMINDAVRSNHDDNALDKFYDLCCKKTTTMSAFRERAMNQMLNFDKASFRELFRKKDSKNIVFVYAFVDDRKDHYLIKKYQKTKLTCEDFSFAKESKKEIFEELKNLGYLDDDGEKTEKVDELNKKEKLSSQNTALNDNINKVWQTLTGDFSHFQSLIARMEILYTRTQVLGLGYGFKICQIKRPSHISPISVASIYHHTELEEHAKKVKDIKTEEILTTDSE